MKILIPEDEEHKSFLKDGKAAAANLEEKCCDLDAAGKTPVEEKTAVSATFSQGKGQIVLFVEDEEQIRELYTEVLEEFGYRVLAAADGEEAIAKFDAAQEEVALAIIDLIMPKMNGREVFQYLRKRRSGIRVLFMSGYPADVFDWENIMHDGLDFIPKPVTPDMFLSKIEGMLGR